MGDTASDFLIKRLHEWGIKRIYGYPGDGINGLMGAMDRQKDKVDFVQVRHEEMAAFMACAHAKFTGEVGVCMATSGPGAIHLLNGLYDASKDHQPVVAIVGQQDTCALGGDYQQEVDLKVLFKDVAANFCEQASSPAQIRHLVDRAMRIAKAKRVVTCIIVPKDIQEYDAVKQEPRAHGTVHSGIGYSVPRIVPAQRDLERAAQILNQGKKVAILIGAGAAEAADEVVQVAELLGAGVAKALLGKAALPDGLPFVTGAIGLLGTKPSYELMASCDTLLMIGTNFPYSEWLPKEGQAKGVQIDIEPGNLALRYPIDVPLHGDALETLRALIPLLERKEDRSFRKQLERSIQDWEKLMETRAMLPASQYLNPQRVFRALSPKLPEGCIITSDSGSAANWFARDLKIRKGMMASLSGNLATMGCGTPYAVGAKFAFPDRPVIATVGDGAMQMNGLNVLITVKKYWQEWSDPRFIVLVLNNRDLNQVTWEQRVMSGNPRFVGSQDLPDFPYARYAEDLGLKGIRMERAEDVERGWDEALSAKTPVIVEAMVDPNVPPLPPHIKLEQAQGLMSSLVKGDPDRLAIAWLSFEEMAAAYMPRAGK